MRGGRKYASPHSVYCTRGLKDTVKKATVISGNDSFVAVGCSSGTQGIPLIGSAEVYLPLGSRKP